jgi:thiamine-phosphate pyrophosphorylase
MARPSPGGTQLNSDRSILCLVVDRGSSRHPLSEAVAEACAGGVDWLQLREREFEGGAWLRWAEELGAAARSSAPGIRILVNRRLDVALAMGADGVHLGFDAMPVAAARALLGPESLIGVSTHTPAEVHSLASGGVDYVHLAPIHPPKSKPASRPPLGSEKLAEACLAGVPVIAQGGLEPKHCAGAIRAGAAGVAVTGAILAAQDPRKAAEELRASLDHPS